MSSKRAIILYCVDVDACSAWLPSNGKPVDATSLSRGLFGANVGLTRLLAFFHKHDIKGTFNIPSHSIESFPDACAKIRDAGHEIGLHGYCHEVVSALSEEQERAVLQKSIEVYKQFTGKHPKGQLQACVGSISTELLACRMDCALLELIKSKHPLARGSWS